jgi:hypothetical protein
MEKKRKVCISKTTEVMRTLELNSGPCDMAASPPMVDLEDYDYVSISSQPESHKRPASPVADDEREQSELVQLLDQFRAYKAAEPQETDSSEEKLDWSDDIEGLDLFGGVQIKEDFVSPTFEETLLPLPQTVFPHYNENGIVREMCGMKLII